METRPHILLADMKDNLKERKRFLREIQKSVVSERWSYCRDFKKEGLTKNREIVKITLEELRRRFPTAQAFECPWFFDHWTFILDRQEIHAKRGHGLGMCNAITTLMQIIIEEDTIRRCIDLRPVCSMYNNDDAFLVFKNESECKRYAEIDRGTCENLGLDYKPKSTFTARQFGILCEQYVGPDWYINNKDPFAYASLANLMKCINASHARSMSLSMNLQNVSPKFAQKVCDYWGPVLFSNEFSRPRSLGGWFRQIEKGVDTSFKGVNGLQQVPQMEEAAAFAYDEVQLRFQPWRHIHKPTKRSTVFPQKWLEERGEKLEISTEDTFRAQGQAPEMSRAWRKFEERLKKSFRTACSWWARNPHRARTYSQIYKSECDKRPKEDIIPPIYEFDRVPSFEASYQDEHPVENPYRVPRYDLDLAIWGQKQEESYPRKMGITSSLVVGAKDFPGRWKGPSQRAITLRHLKGSKIVPVRFWNICLVPNESTFQYWHNPFSIGSVSDAISRNYDSYIPRYVAPEKQELLRLRDQWFGRALHWEEWLSIGTLSPADIFMMYLVRDSWNAEPVFGKNDNMLACIRALKRVPGSGNFVDSAESLSREHVADYLEKWAYCNFVLEHKKNVALEKIEVIPELEDIFCEFQDGKEDTVKEKVFLEDIYFEKESGIPEGYYEAPEEVVESPTYEDELKMIDSSGDDDYGEEEIIDDEAEFDVYNM